MSELKPNPLLPEFGFKEEEVVEIPLVGWTRYKYTGFPKPVKRYRVVWETYDMSIEEPYYWILKYLKFDIGFSSIIKTEDVFSAAENSAFFGVTQVRLGGQQDKISQFLATIGKMVKELFQIVRELRILDERIDYYQGSAKELGKPMKERRKSDDITLKGIFIDMVQGGAKNPASVYGMARELEFTTLPDLFFDAPPMKGDEVDSYVDRLEFNRKVLEVLKRHLKQFVVWKERTYKEMKGRRTFTLQYLRQHYEIIKMYMNWTRPYLKQVARLSMKEGYNMKPEIVTAFESSLVDVEILAHKNLGYYDAVFLITFNYRTRPSLKFVQEAYQRGAIHVGEMDMTLRGYIWTQKQIENYLKMKDKEDFELMKAVYGSVESAMDALGTELFKYLEEAGRAKSEKKEEKKSEPTGIRKWLGLPPKIEKPKAPPEKKPDKYTIKKSKDEAKLEIKLRMFWTYKNFKKGHAFIQW